MLQALSIPTAYRWLVTLIFAVVLVVLSITPGLSKSDDSVFVWLVASTPTLLQKLMHITVYGMLALLLMWSLDMVESRIARVSLTLLITISMGATLEAYQTQVPGRFGTLFDVVLNAIGAVAGVIAALLLL